MLFRMLLRYPLVTQKTMALIVWHAIRSDGGEPLPPARRPWRAREPLRAREP